MSLILIFIILPILVVSYYQYHHHSDTGHRRGGTTTPPSSPSCHPIIGNLVGTLLNYNRFYDHVTDHFISTASLTIHVPTFLHLSHFIATVDPKNLAHVLKSNFHNYVKGSRFADNLTDLLGDGIFNADSDFWSVQRKIASHEFNTKSLRSFVSKSVNHEIEHRLVPLLSRAAKEGRVFDLQRVFQRFMFDTICDVAFGFDPRCLDPEMIVDDGLVGSEFARAFDDASEICIFRLLNPIPAIWKVKRLLDVGSERRFREAVMVLDEYAMKIIESKETELERSKKTDGNHNEDDDDDMDLLTRFMRLKIDLDFKSDHEKRKFYRDVVISFILAGRDTTASALTWFFWLISGHPHCHQKIYDEISPIMNQYHSALGYEDLKKFDYLHAALSESMRLFPPVPMNSRVALSNDTLPDGTLVRKGWMADYSAYAMGRMEKVWGEDCREFRPERWLDEKGEYRPFDQFKYPVFHCGPRICLGKDMAYVQMKMVAAVVIYGFEVVAEDRGGTPERMGRPPYNVSLVMKMKGGLRVKVRRRESQ